MRVGLRVEIDPAPQAPNRVASRPLPRPQTPTAVAVLQVVPRDLLPQLGSTLGVAGDLGVAEGSGRVRNGAVEVSSTTQVPATNTSPRERPARSAASGT